MSSSEENTPENQDSSSESPNEESTSSSSEENTSENQDSSSGNEDVQNLIQDIHDLTVQTRLWRIGAVVVVLLLISLYSWSIVNHVRGEFPKTSEEGLTFLQDLLKDAKGPVLPHAQDLLKDTQNELRKKLEPKATELAKELLKDSRQEISKQLKLLWTNHHAEVLSLTAGELETLVSEVPSDAIKSYNKAITEALAKNVGTLNLPEGGSDRLESGRLSAVIQNGLIATSTERTGDIIAVMFQPHVEELSMMSNHLNSIYDNEYGAMQGRKKQFTLSMALTLMERINIQLSEAEASLKAQQEADEVIRAERDKKKGETSPPNKKK